MTEYAISASEFEMSIYACPKFYYINILLQLIPMVHRLFFFASLYKNRKIERTGANRIISLAMYSSAAKTNQN